MTISGSGGMKDFSVDMDSNYLITSDDRPWKDHINYGSNPPIRHVIIGEGVTNIANNAFVNCSEMESVTIPDTVTSIGDYAFYGCYNIKSVTIPKGVETIGDHAFERCQLPFLIVPPNTVTGEKSLLLTDGTMYFLFLRGGISVSSDWEEYYSIKVTASNGSVTAANGGNPSDVQKALSAYNKENVFYYLAGETAVLTAVPDTGYKFVSWTKSDGTEVSTDNPYEIPVKKDYFESNDIYGTLELTANFEESPEEPETHDEPENFDLKVNFVFLRSDGTRGVPFDIKEGTVNPVLTIKKGDTAVSKSEALKVEITAGSKDDSLTASFSKEVKDLAPGKYTVSVSGLPKEIEGTGEGAKYSLTPKAEVNKKNGVTMITVYLIFSLPEPSAPVVYPLPEDEVGAYALLPDGTKEYLLFHTYDICMAWLGSDELCTGPERCYHKDGK